MLQYLTDDLMPGYDLSKKRMAVRDILNHSLMWTLRDTVIRFSFHVRFDQLADVVAIGRNKRGEVRSLHSDGVTRMVGYVSCPEVIDMRTINDYLT